MKYLAEICSSSALARAGVPAIPSWRAGGSGQAGRRTGSAVNNTVQLLQFEDQPVLVYLVGVGLEAAGSGGLQAGLVAAQLEAGRHPVGAAGGEEFLAGGHRAAATAGGAGAGTRPGPAVNKLLSAGSNVAHIELFVCSK